MRKVVATAAKLSLKRRKQAAPVLSKSELSTASRSLNSQKKRNCTETRVDAEMKPEKKAKTKS